MSFYRKYRPQTIEEIDNVAIATRLAELRQKDVNELPHAYLLTGPRGGGKTTTARIIAKLFNCTEKNKAKRPCGKCDQCLNISSGKNLDILEIDAASNRGIDEIRSLRDAINLAPASSKFKVYIIDEVHMLTTEAFNALLKTLEEPPAHAVFVLATTDPQKVPVTIASRCMIFNFGRAGQGELLKALNRIAKEEKIEIDEEASLLLATYGEGSFRDAVKLLEQASFHKGKIDKKVIVEILALSSEQTRNEFLQSLNKKDIKVALSQVKDLVQTGKDIKTFLTDCLNYLEQQLVLSVTGKSELSINQVELKDLIRRLSQAYSEMKTTPIPVLPLELAVIEFCAGPFILSDPPIQRRVEGSLPRRQASLANASSNGLPLQSKRDPSTDARDDNLSNTTRQSLGLLTLEKLTEHWKDFIEEMKPYNHSVAGVLRSARPKSVENGIVTLEAFYKFHQEKLSEIKTREALATVLKKLFGEKVKVEIVLGRKEAHG